MPLNKPLIRSMITQQRKDVCISLIYHYDYWVQNMYKITLCVLCYSTILYAAMKFTSQGRRSKVKGQGHQYLTTSRIQKNAHLPSYVSFLISRQTDTERDWHTETNWLTNATKNNMCFIQHGWHAGKRLQALPVQWITNITCTRDYKHYKHYLYSGLQILPVQEITSITSITCTVDYKHYLYKRLQALQALPVQWITNITCTRDYKHYLYSGLQILTVPWITNITCTRD